MITPDFLEKVIGATRVAVSRLNSAIVVKIVKSISAAVNLGEERILTPTAIANMRKLMKSGLSIDAIEKIIEKAMPDIKKEIRKAFMEAAKEISLHNSQVEEQLVKNAQLDIRLPNYTVEGIPLTAAGLNMTVYETRVLEAAYRRTNGEVVNIAQSIAPSAYKEYIEACDNAILLIQSGRSPGEAILDAVKELSKKGITVIQYKSGHKDKIDVAVSRAVRTGVNQANSEIILTRAAEVGIQYVLVTQHMGARVTKKNDYTNHAWWQGKVYHLDWKKPELSKFIHEVPDKNFRYQEELKKFLMAEKKFDYPDFVDTCGYGKIEGIIGINCRHTFQAWFPEYNTEDAQIDPRESAVRSDLEQKQRKMEAAMRELRREIEAEKAIEPRTDEIKMDLAVKRKKLREMGEELMDFCKKNRLPYFSQNIR